MFEMKDEDRESVHEEVEGKVDEETIENLESYYEDTLRALSE